MLLKEIQKFLACYRVFFKENLTKCWCWDQWSQHRRPGIIVAILHRSIVTTMRRWRKRLRSIGSCPFPECWDLTITRARSARGIVGLSTREAGKNLFLNRFRRRSTSCHC